jgi:DNA-binding transcriptional ArsR family regulator
MKKELPFRHCAEVLAALAAPERLQIIRLLRTGPRHVSEIAEELGIPLVNLSHHLTVLRHADLLQNEKKGRYVHYSLAPGLLEIDDETLGTEFLNLGCCRLEMPRPDGSSAPGAADQAGP